MTITTGIPIATQFLNHRAASFYPTAADTELLVKDQTNPWFKLDISWDYAFPSESEPDLLSELFPNPDLSAISHLPNPINWSACAAQALTQILFGQRAVTQIERWVEPRLYAALVRRVELNRRIAGTPPAKRIPQITSSRACHVNARVVETVHSICSEVGTYAVCVRLEARRSQWVITAIEIV